MAGVVLQQMLLNVKSVTPAKQDTEEFHSIVSIAEKLTEQLTMEEVTKENPSEGYSTSEENCQETSPNDSGPPNGSTQCFSSLLPRAFSAVLRSEPRSGGEPSKHAPLNLERLQTELTGLRVQFDQMKAQHNKEIKLLMNELDEEKRVRLTLQMEIQRLKKYMSK